MARRPSDPRDAAEALFKPAAASSERLKEIRPAVPRAKEMVSLRLDRDLLAYFQEDGPGWQDRINDALRAAAGL